MRRIIKWFNCKFIKKCRSQKKWQLLHIKFDGCTACKCRECGQVREQ